ncbi:MAG: exopolysaccharide biosynthesis polyprenyl glycosylphosphotransferase [Candidatus Taylorbacteria bacterium]
MPILNKKEAVILFVGDIFIFFLSLLITLLVRYQGEFLHIFESHLRPFSILFLVWVLVFFIAGLYDRHTTLLKGKLPSIVFHSEVVNSIIAVLFFYLIPSFGITPKTNLFGTLFISFFLVFFWRRYGYRLASYRKKQNTMLISSGKEARELQKEINANPRYGMHISSFIDLEKILGPDLKDAIMKKVSFTQVSYIIIDFKNEKITPILPHLYPLLFGGVQFLEMDVLYENIFDRLPLSLIRDQWILENISLLPRKTYDFLKRILDIVLGAVALVLSVPFYPFIIIAIKLDTRGPAFIVQDRVGQNDRVIRVYKFRTMSRNETDLGKASDNRVTRVGLFLRRTRLDELPQLANVIAGYLSLIGPRPELLSGVRLYEKEISYYRIRHLIKPGLSGWAQINDSLHAHHEIGREETRNKLAYDLYYIKNRSFLLDLKIALRTVKILLSFVGK